MAIQHFLSLMDLQPIDLQRLIQRAMELKAMQHAGEIYEPLKNKVLGMVFEKSSTRTRVSFETAMIQFGGQAIFLAPRDTQLGRGEIAEDSARVLSRMVDGIMIRTFQHDRAERFAEYSQVPVINGLTDLFHPCQLLADVQTYVEHRGKIQGKTVAYVGDGNNMCHSFITAARQFDFKLHIATPKGYEPDATLIEATTDRTRLFYDPREAVIGVDLITTDVWASMGHEEQRTLRLADFANFQVTPELMALADKDALFMHCLPAHRGEEVSAEVLDGPQSVIWDEAENRLHAQKALLELLLM